MAGPIPDPSRAALPPHVRAERLTLRDGASTTLWVAAYPLASFSVRVALIRAPVLTWLRSNGISEGMVGGFFVRGGRDDLVPLGELRTGGFRRASVDFDAPFGALRACLHVDGESVAIARRPDLPAEPRGDLLQAGPLLVRGGEVVRGDEEGFSAGSRQFDSDITAGRYPRAALGLTADGRLLAVACDGRADDEAGLTLPELAEALAALGAVDALNLDGGGSTSLVCDGELRNVPREQHGIELAGGRTVATALAFVPR